MKVAILYMLKQVPFGGGNQFLRALAKYYQSHGVLADDAAQADVVLFNSFEFTPAVVRAKLSHQDKIFIHRVDGPIRLYNKMSDTRDRIVSAVNRHVASATIFQSSWSREQNQRLGWRSPQPETVILNAPDPGLFNPEDRVSFDRSRKTRLIAASWSSNWNKGFEVYRWLDQHLDFQRYEMSFIGRSPVSFRNIRHVPPLVSSDLAKELKASDIFLTASRSDPCSNSVIEALHCGLPVIALRDGGHPELVQKAGLLFDTPDDIPALLEEIVSAYDSYAGRSSLPPLSTVADAYLEFMRDVKAMVDGGRLPLRRLGCLGRAAIGEAWWRARLQERVQGLAVRVNRRISSRGSLSPGNAGSRDR